MLCYPQVKEQLDFCDSFGKILTLIGFTSVSHKLTFVASIRLFLIDFVVLTLTLLLQIFTHSSYRRHRLDLTRGAPRSSERRESEAVGSEVYQEHRPSVAIENQSDTRNPFTGGGGAGSAVGDRSEFRPASSANRREAKLRLIKIAQVTRYFFELVFLVLLGTAGVFSPSATSAFYFISLLGILTLFGANVRFARFYEHFRVITCIYTALHLIALFVYQLQPVQAIIDPDSWDAK